MKKKNSKNLPTAKQIEKYEMLYDLIISVKNEIQEFSKKKPDEPLNKLKVRIINKVLKQCKELISSEPTDEFLELLDDETLPTNSDAILIVGQFITAMNQFKEKYQEGSGFDSHWLTKENP